MNKLNYYESFGGPYQFYLFIWNSIPIEPTIHVSCFDILMQYTNFFYKQPPYKQLALEASKR